MSPRSSGGPITLGVDARVIDDRYHGIGRCTYEVVSALAELDRFDFVFFTSDQQHSSRLDLHRLVDRVGARTIPFNFPVATAAQQAHWPRALHRAKVDVSLFPYHLGAPLAGPSRRMTIVHDCIFETDLRFAPDARTRMLYRTLTTATVRRLGVLTPSAASAAEISRFYRVKIPLQNVVPWGVSPLGNAGEESELDPLPARYYLHVGAHRPHKNVELLVRAMAEMEADEHLVLVGSSDERWPSAITSLAASLGVAQRLIHLESVSDAHLAALYAGARAFLYPSLVEGFGLPLLEAMSCGVPVIASDIPVFREVAGADAVLVPPMNIPAWGQALRRLRNDAVREDYIDRGRARAAAATWHASALKLADALDPR